MYTTNTEINNQLSIWLIVMFWIISFMIIVGGLTRLTDSGLSITEWELFSGFFPPLNQNDWIVYFNLYKQIPEFRLQNYNMNLSEFKVIFWWEWAHRFLGRLIGLGYLIPLIYWNYLKINISRNITKKLNVFIPLFFLILIFLQISIGAFVSGMDAGKIYNSWPLMGNSYFPNDNNINNLFEVAAFSDPSLVQFIHRNLAYLIGIFYILIFYKIYRNKMYDLYKSINYLGIFIILQIILGIFTVLYGAQIYVASMHQISSIFLVSSSIYFFYLNTKFN